MTSHISLAHFLLRRLVSEDSGQDLIEYALVVALIAFAAITGMGSLATSINTAFTGIGNTLAASI
jgi:pilus assembly protein Flp/PilA